MSDTITIGQIEKAIKVSGDAAAQIIQSLLQNTSGRHSEAASRTEPDLDRLAPADLVELGRAGQDLANNLRDLETLRYLIRRASSELSDAVRKEPSASLWRGLQHEVTKVRGVIDMGDFPHPEEVQAVVDRLARAEGLLERFPGWKKKASEFHP